ncbi:tRNA (adenosine(37)-N6)-dimethylallyltransferase MiaA [Aurantiacibacter suaedae]|uniref:tRNA (adenosine(37)-N6)-dimethylallyltransferase MiaA n=1 Tax=Aurantiacibacter suaedae TaxID=2545755 RepID=UPI0010F627CB|nr:tRNA (adenosine(37)-N6)-dimethylallyltransferase MiaA [Aurantiacibacter suaedae]
MSTRETPTDNAPRNVLALIAGPTASGKSDLAVRLALALQERGREARVINADSAQVYADLSIVSARPTEAEMQGVPHLLFGAWDGAQACSAADWAEAAKREVFAAHEADAVPILVGGTGLYIRTLLEGIAPIPAIDPIVRETVRALPLAEAYAALQAEDPARAAQLNAGDSQRVARALEVVRSTGRSMLEWQRHLEGGIADQVTLAPLVLLPEREALFDRCDRRFAAMVKAGALEEVEALYARGLEENLPVMRAIGVPELGEVLRGRASVAEAIANGQRATRQYAKRQYTWLRNQLPDDWKRALPENIDLASDFEMLLPI